MVEPLVINQRIGTNERQDEEESEKRGYDKSTIQFPYGDLKGAEDVSHVISGEAGTSCTVSQLAAYMKTKSVKSGAFRSKISTARLFGLIDVTGDRVSLTSLGREIADQARREGARVAAFLNVPLYRAIFDKYDGYVLPKDIGLENDLVTLGVAPKQKARARQVLQRSAEQAGFFAQGRDRLVLPPSGPATRPLAKDEREVPAKDRADDGRGGEGGGGSYTRSSNVHPAIEGLLLTLPQTGASWSSTQQEQWIEAVRNIFKLIYLDPDN